jgi:hypothetical protein
MAQGPAAATNEDEKGLLNASGHRPDHSLSSVRWQTRLATSEVR